MKITITHDLSAGIYESDDSAIAITTAGDTQGTITLDFSVAQPEPPADDPPTEAPPDAPSAESLPPLPVNTGGPHAVRASTVIDGVLWSARVNVGEDPRAPGQCMRFVNAAGDTHPGLLGMFWADGCNVGAMDGRDGFDYAGTLKIEYDDAVVWESAGVNFWNNTANQTIRYGGRQPAWHPVDRSLFPNYASSDTPIPLTSLKKYDWSYNGHGYANTPSMTTTGMRGEIAFVPDVDTPFVAQPSDDAYAVVRKVADNTGSHPIYAIDRDTGKPFDVTTYPNATQMSLMQGAFAGNPIAPYQNKKQWDISGSPYDYNAAHAPGYNFVAAAATGSARDRWHASVWGNAALISLNPDYRRTSGVWAHSQERGSAWSLRSLFLAAHLSDMPEYFAARLDEQRVQGERQVTHPLGFQATYVTRKLTDGSLGAAPWEENFTRLVVGTIAKKRPEWQTLNDRLKVFLAQLFASKYWQFVANYILAEFDPAGTPITTPQDAVRHVIAGQWADTDMAALMAPDVTQEEIDALIAAHVVDGWRGKPGDFPDNYPYSAQGYAAIACAAVATMCGDGPEWRMCQTVPTKRQYAQGWQWNVVP